MIPLIKKGDSVQFIFPAYHDETATDAHIRKAAGTDLLTTTIKTQVGYGLGIRPVQPVVTPEPDNQRTYGMFTGSFADTSSLDLGEYYVAMTVSGFDVNGDVITHTRDARFYLVAGR